MKSFFEKVRKQLHSAGFLYKPANERTLYESIACITRRYLLLMIIAVAVMINVIFYVVEYLLQYTYGHNPTLLEYQVVLSAVTVLVVLVVVFVFLLSLEGIRDKMVGNLKYLLEQLESTNNGSPADLTKEICVRGISCNDELHDIVSVINQKSQQIQTHIDHLRLVNGYIHHEFNTPLATLVLKLELLQKKHPEIDCQSLLDDIYSLSRIITSLGSLSSPGSEREKETVQIDELVQKQRAELEPHFPTHTIQYEGDRALSTETNPVYLAMIVRNILENSLKYSAGGSTVIVRYEEGSITIQDFGEGMSDETKEFMRMPYRQKDKSRGLNSGFGLGLSLVSKLVSVLGMNIVVRSVEGEGTTVTLSFS